MQEKSSCPEITDTIQNLLINRVNAQLDQVLQNLTLEDLKKTMDPSRYVGRAAVQVDAYLNNVIRPLLEKNKELLGVKAEINV